MSGLMSVSQQVLSKVVAQVKKKRLPFKVTWPRLVISQFRIRSMGEVIHKANKVFFAKNSPVNSRLKHKCILEMNVLHLAPELSIVTHSRKKQFNILGAVFQSCKWRLGFNFNHLLFSWSRGLPRARRRVLFWCHVNPLYSAHAIVPIHRLWTK